MHMALAELQRLVAPPESLTFVPTVSAWLRVQSEPGVHLPEELQQLCAVFGERSFRGSEVRFVPYQEGTTVSATRLRSRSRPLRPKCRGSSRCSRRGGHNGIEKLKFTKAPALSSSSSASICAICGRLSSGWTDDALDQYSSSSSGSSTDFIHSSSIEVSCANSFAEIVPRRGPLRVIRFRVSPGSFSMLPTSVVPLPLLPVLQAQVGEIVGQLQSAFQFAPFP
jgi:hypothetical protein